MKYIFIIITFGFCNVIFSQNKGATPLVPKAAQSTSNATYAVVVGISDYQDKDIPDLRYADKDAEAFANFLKSKAGGNLDQDHLKVLLNHEATVAQFAISLDWLMEVVKENDQVIIYFSGHGDVEKRTITQPGYLLCWDAPARVYLAGGALALPMFQDIISTLSTQNKAKVVVITDACRSGKLAGSSVGGSQITGTNLAKQYSNEIKILSCQPHEYSIEGEQWGGGRGAFSFNLIEALYGFADNNNDLYVTLQEVGRYLEDHVSAQVAPVSQVPMVIGNRMERMAEVDGKLLTEFRSGRTNQMQLLSSVETRGMEDDVLSGLDTSIRLNYHLFKKALKDKIFLEPKDACAEFYFNHLMAESKLARLHSTMTRNYAAALQDDAQQTLNEWLRLSQNAIQETTPKHYLPHQIFTEKVKSYPRCLDRAAELLGQSHYMYSPLKARKYFFEGYLMANSNTNPNTAIGAQALSLFRQSLQWQAEQPQVYWQMSKVFGYNLLQPDSVVQYARKAIELYPNWIPVCTDAAFVLSHVLNRQELAKPFLEHAYQIDSNSSLLIHNWAIFNFGQKNYLEAEAQLKRAIALDSTLANTWNNLGYLYNLLGRYADAEIVLKKCIALDSTSSGAWNNLGDTYVRSHRDAEAEIILNKAIAIDSNITEAWFNLGLLYYQNNRFSDAVPLFKKAISLDSTMGLYWTALGSSYAQSDQLAEGEAALKKGLEISPTNTSGWNEMGMFYTRTQRFEEAEPIFKQAIILDSTYANAWGNLGAAYNMTRRFVEAEPVLKKSLKIDSNNIVTWNNLAYLYIQTRQFVNAIPICEKTIQMDSSNVHSWNNYGFILLQTKRFSEAEHLLHKAIIIQPDFAYPHKHLGMVCYKTNRPKEARQHFQKALELNPNYASAMLGLSYLLHSEGKTNEAFTYIEQAIGKGSTFEQLEEDENLAQLRALPEWNKLMNKYFPGRSKN